MTETTTGEQVQGTEASEQKASFVTNCKHVERRKITEQLGVKPKELTEKEEDSEIVECVEAMEIPGIGVVMKTIVYDGYLPSVSKILIPGATLKQEEEGRFVIGN